MPADDRSRELLRRAGRTLRDVARVREALTPDGVSALVEARFPLFQRIPTGVVAKADREVLQRELRAMLETGARVLERLERQGEEAPVDEAERTAVEAVVAFFGRPALLVANGSFGPPPIGWEMLEPHRDAIERTIDATGRIELAGMGMVGTGFLVADHLVMTNAHVATAFGRNTSGTWALRLGMVPRIDWLGEHGRDVQSLLPITGIAAIHPRHDLALLHLGPEAAGSRVARPAPLRLATRPPVSTEARAVYTVGYPQLDHTDTPPEALVRIFSDVFGAKRLQPGELLWVDAATQRLAHDCSTLGGSSGSPIVDLETDTVVGLHFGGSRKENLAVALWHLADDPILQRAGVQPAVH